MNRVFTGLAGFLCILISHSLLASISYGADLLVYALALYTLFYLPKFPGFSFLIGITAGVELLFGLTRFGQGSLLALLIYGFTLLLSQQLRFTSPFPRYIVALLFTMLSYTLLLIPTRSFASHTLPFLMAFLIAIILSYAASNHNRPTEHEFI